MIRKTMRRGSRGKYTKGCLPLSSCSDHSNKKVWPDRSLMFRFQLLACALPLVAALGACVDPAGPQVQVDLTQSEFTKPATVRFTVHNGGDTYAYFSGCESPIPVVLEKEVNGTWEEAGDFNTSCSTVRAQLSLQPGASHLDSIPVADASHYRLSVWFGSNIQAPYAYATRSGDFQVH